MPTPDETVEKREKELENRIQMLESQLDRLTSHMGGGAGTPSPTVPVSKPETSKSMAYADEEMPELTEEVLGWASRNAVLPRLATVCFLMVIALVLRTITDSGLVTKLVGSGLGMGYASALMAFGWYKYSRESLLAPVFAACGVVLMSTIVVETHMHFKSLPLVPAYLTLMATGFCMALMSRRFNAFTPISVGVLGMCFAGAAIDYPHPFFPYLSLVLFTANVLGYAAARLKSCSWLRWSVLVVTMLMLQLWGIRLGIIMGRGEAIPPELAPVWYLPVLAVFFLTFIFLSLLGITNAGNRKISRFDFSLPTLSVIWAFTLARHMAEVWQMNMNLLGVIGLLGAASLLGITFWFAGRGMEGAPGTNTFAFAGAVLLVLALPAATGGFIMSLPVVSLVAITMAIVSRIWENGGIRGTTYLMNIYACVALVIALRGEGTGGTDPVNMLPAGLLAVISIYHYQWCRQWPVPFNSAFFDTFDRNDRSAVLLLLGGLACGFFMISVGIYQTVQFVPAEMQRDTFRCGQSVLINASAIILIVWAYLRQNREIRNVAILVTVIGAIKVFLYDLLGTHGLPLVFSIFSFGMAAAVESLALSKWQKKSVGHSQDGAVTDI
ncbi:MAG: hypothetical protein PHR66_03830 [Desulfuromonadaceae bacterium]|nr:hypothetical protein [Desulfuromonadaceae bacterium]